MISFGHPNFGSWLLVLGTNIMRFPLSEQLTLPVTFERYVQGALHPDGRRYLPQLIFRLNSGILIGVVDRHHYVDPELVGLAGVGQFVYLLSNIRLQTQGQHEQGIRPESVTAGYISTAPEAYGRVVAVPSWEHRSGELPYESLYTELLLDVGDGIVGVRTSMTADDMTAKVGAPSVAAGDWLAVSRSRIDILGFEPLDTSASSAAA